MTMHGFIEPPCGLSPTAYGFYVVDEAFRLGEKKTLITKKNVVFYSGPSEAIQEDLKEGTHLNDYWSKVLADKLGFSRINDTVAWKFLNAQDIDLYFRTYYAGQYSGVELKRLVREAYTIIWGIFSEAFSSLLRLNTLLRLFAVLIQKGYFAIMKNVR